MVSIHQIRYVTLADAKQENLRKYINWPSGRNFNNSKKKPKTGLQTFRLRTVFKQLVLRNEIFHGLFYKRNKHFIKSLLKMLVIANKI